ncbi:MAG: hypothetical protein B7X56_01810 [Burkholderiales bacterium 34-67-9]|nr:MAG: hypothetical protein B7X56_01810 [Burkholderiales bacterium 34-67-9]
MNELAQHIKRTLVKYPKHFIAGLGAVLLGTGVTAFGVAPLEAEIANLPVQQIVETVPHAALQPLALAAPIAASASASATPAELQAPVPFVLFRTDFTRRDDTVQSLLQRLGVNDSAAHQFVRSHPDAAVLMRGPAGKLVRAETDDDQRLLRLSVRWLPSNDSDRYQRLLIERSGSGFVARVDQVEAQRSVRVASGTIRSTLFAATEAADLPDRVVSQLVDIFTGQIDFRLGLQRGDSFRVVYEAIESEGELLRYGRLLSAEFVNKGRAHQVLWFEDEGQPGAYFTFAGESTRRAFLASPLEFSRISSGFGLRFHPVTGLRRPHLGVDFPAPIGTPVRSVGDGVVQFAGSQRGFGNVVFIQHRKNIVTVYAHLHRIDVRQGQSVAQSQYIGQVGCTGVCTGPHVHFEYRLNGIHRDPMLLVAEGGGSAPLTAALRPAFQQAAADMKQKLAAATTLVQASAQ